LNVIPHSVIAVCFDGLKEGDEKAGRPSTEDSNDEQQKCMNRRRIRSKCKIQNSPSRNFFLHFSFSIMFKLVLELCSYWFFNCFEEYRQRQD